jgi:uncharacterized protein YqeY
MNLLDKIKAATLSARKAHDTNKALPLITLVSDATMIGKNAGREVTDIEVVEVIKKFINNVNITLASCTLADGTLPVANQNIEKCLFEKALFEQFLPEQLDEPTLINIIACIISDIRASGQVAGMGDIMKALKTSYAGKYDGKLASTLIKKALS